MTYEGICRTAPATPGLLITGTEGFRIVWDFTKLEFPRLFGVPRFSRFSCEFSVLG